MKKTLIVYFSWKGHTEKVAHALALTTGSPLLRIEPVKDPGRRIAWLALKALLGGREDIKPIQSDLSDVDQLIIATPVWSQNLPPFTRQYLSGITNCSGKQFSVVIEMGKSGSEKVLKNIRRILEGKGMKFIADVTTLEKDVDAENYTHAIEEFARKIQGQDLPG